MFKIITLCDSNYFDCGKLFLESRNNIKNHDIILYHPDLTSKQLSILDKHNIEHFKLSKTYWDEKMQFLKFEYITHQIKIDEEKKYNGFLLSDWDVFFVNDFEHLFNYDFDLCLVTRPNEIKNRVLRAYACGSGFFFKHRSLQLFELAKVVIENGKLKSIPEYDEIWNTLEKGRPAHKTHKRTDLRWWVDQIFISSIVLRFLNENNYKVKFGLKPVFGDFEGYKIAFVNEKYYNACKSNAILKEEKNVFIRHLQYHGRSQLVGKEKARIKEKLDG